MNRPRNPAPDVWRLTERDVPEAAVVLSRAFVDDPFFQFAIPNNATRSAQLPPFFDACLRYGVRFGQVLASGRTSGVIEGVAWWYHFPDAHFNAERTAAVGFDDVDRLLGEGSARITEFAGHVDEHVDQSAPNPRANIDQLGVLPEAQGHGIGTALVGQIIADATVAELPCCLWTVNPDNVPFYERAGFQIACSGTGTRERPSWWAFVRPVG